jgi:hypothetical protein
VEDSQSTVAAAQDQQKTETNTDTAPSSSAHSNDIENTEPTTTADTGAYSPLPPSCPDPALVGSTEELKLLQIHLDKITEAILSALQINAEKYSSLGMRPVHAVLPGNTSTSEDGFLSLD